MVEKESSFTDFGLIQGFPALRKAVITHVKKYDNFSRVFNITNHRRKTEITYLTLIMAYLAAENENRQLEDFPQAEFGPIPEKISSVGKEKVKN